MKVGGNTYSTPMGSFGAKAILSISFEVQSRGEKCQLVFWYTHVANDHLNGTCIKIRWGEYN